MGYVSDVRIGNNIYPIGSTLFGLCSTPGSVAAKVVNLSNFDTLKYGVTIHVQFTYANTANEPTLNVNNTGAKPLYSYGTTEPLMNTNTSWASGAIVSLTYNGYSWIMNFDGGDKNAVTVLANQEFTETEKANARANIGASSFSGDFDDLINKPTLGTAAATDSSIYATAAQGTKADDAMPKSGGTFTGAVSLSADPTSSLHAATKQYVDGEVQDIQSECDSLSEQQVLIMGGLPQYDDDNDLIVLNPSVDPYDTTVYEAVSNKADKASPIFTGTPAAPTATIGTDTTQIATTAFVQNELNIVKADLNQAPTEATATDLLEEETAQTVYLQTFIDVLCDRLDNLPQEETATDLLTEMEKCTAWMEQLCREVKAAVNN